ncbi:MAG: hypothetical protein IT444_09360 [Phycisphaeraceae bacterium]|nr:hypothetical protein [Phycisphaeraceae bacterium]
MSLQQKLRDLFILDSQLRGMRTRLDGSTKRLEKQKTKLDLIERQRAELADQIKQNSVKASALEKQVKDVDLRVETLRAQMNSVKNNKEYSALLIEVNTLKLDKGKLEDQALEQMTKVDQLKGQAGELDGKAEEQQKLVVIAESEVNKSREELGTQLDELTAKRDAAEQEVPVEVRIQFNRLSEIHEGEALAPVTEESRRNMEYNCGGCYMGLPVERVNALMRRPDDLVLCPSCGRILYMEEDLKASFTTSK